MDLVINSDSNLKWTSVTVRFGTTDVTLHILQVSRILLDLVFLVSGLSTGHQIKINSDK